MPELILRGRNDELDLDYVAKHGRGIQALAGLTGFGLPPIQTRWIEGAGNGARYRGRRILPRDIDLLLLIQGEDELDMRQLTNRLARILRDQVRLVIKGEDQKWYIDGHWVGGGDFAYGVNGQGLTEVDLVITIRAGRPFWRAQTRSIKTLRPGSGTPPAPLLADLSKLRVAASQISGEVELENDGDADSFPVWEVRGPATRFTAALPNGDQFVWEGTLLADETLTIDTEEGTVVDQDGNNRYGELGEAPVMWEIPPGTTTATALLEGSSAGAWGAGDLLRTNHAQNPSFATDDGTGFTPVARTNYATSPRFTDTTRFDGGTGSYTTTVETSGGALGVGYLRAEAAGDDTDSPQSYALNGAGTDGVAVTPGQPFTASWYARRSTSDAAPRIDVNWFDSAGLALTTETGTDSEIPLDTWTRVSQSWTVPASAAYAQAVARYTGTPTSGSTWDFANALVEIVATVKPYFDGGHSQDANLGVLWNGTARESTSLAHAAGLPYPNTITPLQQDGTSHSPNHGNARLKRSEDPDLATRGGFSGCIVPKGDNADTYANVTSPDDVGRYLEPGKTYRVSATVRVARAHEGPFHENPNRHRSIAIFCRDEADAGDYIRATSPSGTNADNAVTRVSVTATITDVPSGIGGYVRLGNGSMQADEPVWWDELLIEEIDPENPPVDAAYFDGSFPSSQGGYYAWTGIGDASASTKSSAVLTGASQITASWEAQRYLVV